jgi:hypothetical protein
LSRDRLLLRIQPQMMAQMHRARLDIRSRTLRQVFQAMALLLLPATAKPSMAQNSVELKTIGDVSAFMQTYYLHPQPERIAEVIDALSSSGFVRPTQEFVVVGFFSEVFAANPNRVPEWQDHVAKQDNRTKWLLEQALSVSKTGDLLKSNRHSAPLNDGWWAAFFASGNPKFIDKVIDQLQYCDDRKDEMLFFAGATAKWSLATNAQTNPLVRSTLENAKATASARQRELINEVLNEDPARLQQEMTETVQRQRKAGKWK